MRTEYILTEFSHIRWIYTDTRVTRVKLNPVQPVVPIGGSVMAHQLVGFMDTTVNRVRLNPMQPIVPIG